MRRASDRAAVSATTTMETIVNSSILKAFNFIITSILFPLVVWVGTRFVSNLDSIQSTLQMIQQTHASDEVRMKYAEAKLESLQQQMGQQRAMIDQLMVKLAEADVRIAQQGFRR